MDCKPPCSVPYFHGRLSREEAEGVLKNNGSKDGLFLLRESLGVAGNYAVSLCFRNQVHHYSIERMQDGTVMIQEGKKYPGPIELVEHHRTVQDGFLSRLTYPLNLPEGQSPQAWPGVSMLELELALHDEATKRSLKGAQLANALGPQRSKFVSIVAKDLHKEQPWYHGDVNREKAEQIIAKDKHRDGKYLVRRKKEDGTLVISLSYAKAVKHYLILVHRDGKFGIAAGPKFDNIMDLVGHYYNKADGMLCSLTIPCVRPGFVHAKKEMTAAQINVIYGKHGSGESSTRRRSANRPLPETPNVLENQWDQPEAAAPPLPPDRRSMDVDQKIYDEIPLTEDLFNLCANDLELQDELGAGCFGSVMKGSFNRRGISIPVAVKTLKSGSYQAEDELLREAKVMSDLKHGNIVRMIGVCRAETIMLLLELAPLGPLHKYVKKERDFPMASILRIMYQVAKGMEYLESKNFVHRDLAARNVLLVNDKYAKISDFGMSKALGLDNNYYVAETAGRWPLKWYAPECIWYWKFDSKSDVWSYGITVWEATSYGAKPYKGMKGQAIIDMLEKEKRLDCPERCPPEVYDIMLSCWNLEKDNRPMFKAITRSMSRYK